MSLRLALTATAALTLATPAFAQQAPVAPPAAAAPAAPQPETPPTPEEQALIARVEAAGGALEPVMADLEPRAAAIREDATLTTADKETRIRALLADHQPALTELSEAIQALVLYKAASEGASPEEAAQAASMVGGMVSAQIAQALINGETAGDGE